MNSSMKEPFHLKAMRSALTAWWESLEENKGERARLRRATSPVEALLLPSTVRLLNQLDPQKKRNDDFHLLRIGAIAGVLAHVKNNDQGHPARRMATPKTEGGAPRISESRFRRLLACQELDALHIALTRVVQQLDGQINVFSLAGAIYTWNTGKDRTRREWAREYYANAPQKQ